MRRFEAAQRLRERELQRGTDSAWILAAALLTVAVSCVWPCWQLSAIALLSVALWADENWEAVL